jgi:transposase-like protein
MGRQRRVYPEHLKAKVALEAIKGVQTMAELSAAFGIHAAVIAQWKKHLLEHAPELFIRNGVSPHASSDEETNKLYAEIGRLKLENDWLKKRF